MTIILCRVSTEGQDVWLEQHSHVTCCDDGLPYDDSHVGVGNNDDVRNLSAPPSMDLQKKVDMQWIGEVFANERVFVDVELLQIYENILLRNEIYSKEDLVLFSEALFMTEVVNNHVAELKPPIRRIKFESLHTYAVKQNRNYQQRDEMLLLQQEFRDLQQRLAQFENVNPDDLASKRLMSSLQRKFDAVFQSTLVGHGNQVQEVVATREGATISIVNPKADEQNTILLDEICTLQEKIEELEYKLDQACNRK